MSARITIFLAIVVLGQTGCAGVGVRSTDQPTQALSQQQLLEVAGVLEQSGDTVRAEQYLHAALEQGGDERAIVPRLLRLYVADGQYRLAIDHAENYLRRHPQDRKLGLFLGTLYLAVGLDARAQREYERVLSHQPDDAHAHFALASLLHDSGHEPGKADEHFRAYLALMPQGAHAEEARALLMTEKP